MHQPFKIATLFYFLFFTFHFSHSQTIIQYLSGTDKDHTRNWDFFCTKGRKSGAWTTIPVPSCWEMQGFGSYTYYKDVPDPEQGMYKYHFTLSPAYKNKKIRIVFEGSMTDTEVKINGQPAGEVHQGGFCEFKYDITGLVALDKENLLEVTVSRHSTNESVNRAERKADFWLFGGIYRPVYLEITPQAFIERTAVDAKANGDFSIQVFTGNSNGKTITAQVQDLKGNNIGKPFTVAASDSLTLRQHFNNITPWNPEQPQLYKVLLLLNENGKTIHTTQLRFGFRTTELRLHDGFYVNGVKVIFKGVCRHSEWPETGRTLSRPIHLMDIATIKGMNMNAVRMSHYPPDKEFLDLCDSLGLFVLDELTGWQAAYDTTVGRKLLKELVVRDVNHPSIVLWDNGNEGGWNRALDGDFALYDPQQRWVIHPWERFNGTNTKHYPDFKYLQDEAKNGKEIFFPTEFMHGLFDGGHGAALQDFWNEMLHNPLSAGGFLWSLHDEGIVRSDRHDSIDVAGNQAPDGIVGPHREKEGSYYTIKEIWSPVYIETQNRTGPFTGNIAVENRYLYTNLAQIKFKWQLVNFPAATDKTTALKVVQKGELPGPSLPPGAKGTLLIPLPDNSPADAFYLTAYNAKGDTICTWSWAMEPTNRPVSGVFNVTAKATTSATENDRTLTITNDGIRYIFDKTTGYLQQVTNGKGIISFGGGPALGYGQMLTSFKHSQQGNSYIVEPAYKGDSLRVRWTFQIGQYAQLSYSYLPPDTTDFTGITFNYPEEKITGVKYLGRGPYRVWKNRLKGPQLGVWQKDYNNTITGENWLYPEFKGYFADLYWVQVQTKESAFTVYTSQPDVYLQLLQPGKPKAAGNNNTSPPFPKGSIGFMNAIPAIGTKFQKAEQMGPQSQKNVRQGNVPVSGTLYFDFRGL